MTLTTTTMHNALHVNDEELPAQYYYNDIIIMCYYMQCFNVYPYTVMTYSS